MRKFNDTQEAVFRRQCRDAIRRAKFTRGERDIYLALLNYWFKHRVDGPISPGRDAIAKRAKVCAKSVSRAMAKLDNAGVVVKLASGAGNATRLRLDLVALFPFCGAQYPVHLPGQLIGFDLQLK